MAKNKKNKPVQKKQKTEFRLTDRQQHLIFITIMVLYLLLLLKPLTIDGLSPQGVDAIASKGQTHQIVEYKENTGEEALWNPYIFSGMPIYQLLPAKAFSIDIVVNWLSGFFSTPFMYYLVAGLGLYLLLIYLKMTPLISFFATMTFLLMPHYSSLYLEGHYAKFRAVMFIPWIIVGFLYFLSRRNLLSAALLALVFGLQIRTHHYQIVFYTALVMFALGIYPFISDLIQKEYTKFFRSTFLLIAALTLGIGMAAQPLFLANEYLPYSKRGKTTIDLNQPRPETVTHADPSAGVKIDYAMQWSTHPSEMLTWIVPRFYGGMSGEKYSGSAVPALRNRVIPGYWGYMPFTQSYEYMGVLTLMLAAIGLYVYRRDKLIISLSAITLFFILLSFGRHFRVFYELFFNFVPYFNKFRAPMMSVTLTGLIMSIFASFGMKGLLQFRENPVPEYSKKIIWILGGFFALGVLIWIFGTGFDFHKTGENYEPQVMELIRNIRSEFFNQDLFRYFLLILIGGGLIFGLLKQKIGFMTAAIFLTLVALIDLTNIQGRYHKEFVDVDRLEKQYFRPTSTDNFILQDKEVFRIMPPPQEMNNNRWAYYHQTIGGYSPIKMFAMEEILENCFTQTIDGKLPFNLNVLKILNAKYIILPQKIDHELLDLMFSDDGNNLHTYQLNDHLQRGYFVDSVKVIPDQYDRLRFINQSVFNPATQAILEKEPESPLSKPDSTANRLVEFNPNLLRFEVFTDKSALFVISESYYPPGWKIHIDDQEVSEIYKTNHVSQSVIIPPGQHTVSVTFKPESYYTNLTMARLSVAVIYILIIISAGIQLKWIRSIFLKAPKRDG